MVGSTASVTHSPRSIIARPLSHTDSIRTIRLEKDYSLWHEKSCRPLIVQIIRGQTTGGVRRLMESERLLKEALRHQIELRQEEDRTLDLNFLSFSSFVSDVEFIPLHSADGQLYGESLKSLDTSRTSLSSETSRHSTGSFASQVSDSGLNDLEQSAEVLLQDLQEGKATLLRREQGRTLSAIRKFTPLMREAQELHDALNAAISQVRGARPDMASMGFSDLGVELNIKGELYRNSLLRYLDKAPQIDALKNDTSQGEPQVVTPKEWGQKTLFNKLKKAFGISRTAQSGEEGYPRLTQGLNIIMTEVGRIIDRGIALRESLLRSAYPLMDDIAMELAQSDGVEIVDSFQEHMLVRRVFKRPV
ncbi:hypothetical protein BKA56DRAFT_597422 [Ilyonectria sp. MPI-CAGE-AT-0026]|nr:hypothetical protein BKA56DRAFT_597422 [Ilyonectria sp. MPI-CAGE-AT-0026]